MKKFLEILCSMPVILLMLYFMPFLGVVLIVTRLFVVNAKRNQHLAIVLIVLGVILLIPKLVDLIPALNITFIEEVLSSNIYHQLVSYSKFLVTVGVICLIVYYLLQKLIEKIKIAFMRLLHKEQQVYRAVAKENDLKMKMDREKAQRTNVVICPYCGADNMLSEVAGTCKFCRRKLENK